MRSLFFLFTAVAGCGQAWAQHQAGSSAGHAPASSASGFHSGVRAGGGAAAGTTMSTLSHRNPSPSQLIYPTPIGLQPTFSGYSGINRGALPVNTGRTGYRGQRYGFGYGGGYFIPYLSTYDDYSAPYPYYDSSQDQAAQSANVTANLLGEQVQRLASEVEALRADRSAASQTPSQSSDTGYRPAPLADDPPETPVTLVLQGGQKLQLKSYAVMGQDIWDFSKQPARRISLSTVDLPASKQATEAAGGEFPEIGK